MTKKYVFKKRWKRVLIGLFDFIVGALFLIPKIFRKPLSENPKHILVIRLDSLGDGVLTLPAIRTLQERFPVAKIDFLVSPAIRDLFRILFPNATVHTFENTWLSDKASFRKSWDEFFRTVKKLRELHYDLGIDFRGDLRSILLMRFAKIPNRWGRGRTGGGFLLTRSSPQALKHEVLENVELVKVGGTSERPQFQTPSLPVHSKESIEKWLAPFKAERKIIIHPGAGYPSKRWPLQNFATLVQKIQKEKLGLPIFIGSSEEKNILSSYQNQLKGQFLDLVGKTSLEELLSLLAQADLFIGNDSGPAHLAALLGLKSVVVFSGTNDFRRWAPWSSVLRILHHPVPCSPCEEKECPLERHFCMEDISAEEVFRAVEEMLRD